MSQEQQKNAWSLKCHYKQFTPEAAFELIVYDEPGETPTYKQVSAEIRARHKDLKIIGHQRVEDKRREAI